MTSNPVYYDYFIDKFTHCLFESAVDSLSGPGDLCFRVRLMDIAH